MNSRIILITGAYRGIGLATARLLAQKGHAIILTARDAVKAGRAASQLQTENLNVEGLVLDVTSSESVERAAARVGEIHGRLDTLINNAAILLDNEDDVESLTPEAFSQTLEVNTVAPLRVIQALLPWLRKSQEPRIVNVSSRAGQLSDGEPSTWAPAYSSSKAALNALTQQLAASWPHFAINSVCPGWCTTEMGGPGASLTPAEGADSIAWLAAESPQTLTGGFFRERAPVVW